MSTFNILVKRTDGKKYDVISTFGDDEPKPSFRVKRHGTKHVPVLVPAEIKNTQDAVEWFIRVNPAVRIEP